MRPRKPSELGKPELPPSAASDERARTLDYVSPSTAPSTGTARPDIPGYTIERQLGRGGSATVYLARERKHDRLVAVKVLHPALVASLQAQRFLREIEIIARLAHPNILPLLDSGVVGQVLYYVTPYVEGESLRARLERERKLGLDDAVRIVREVAEALDYAHRQGVIHRDVKPENILLADGHAVVADFGIARAVSAATDHRLTTGDIVGTPLYMSPEQVAAKGGVDGRSDIYGLACVLYELLSGRPPFVGDDPQQIIAQHLSDPAPSLRGVTPRVPKGVEWALNVALSKSPADRFATASEFAQALATSGTWLTTAKTAGRIVGRGIPARVGWPLLAVAAMVAVAVLALDRGDAAGVTLRQRLLIGLGFGEPALDTTLYVVLPSDSSGLKVAGALRSGLGRWRDISVADEASVAEMARRHDGASSPGSARDVATALHAGRYIRTEVTRAGDSLDVSAALFDARTNQRIVRSQVRVGSDSAKALAAAEGLVDSVLFREAISRERVVGSPGTASVLARQAYLRGQVALANGDFAQADSEFFGAARQDPDFAQPLVWLATVRSWAQVGSRSWAQIPSQAAAKRHDLSASDSTHLDALSAVASGDYGRACAMWRHLATTSNDYAAWYALGNCLNKDRAVVRSDGSGAWHFRSSIEESIAAYRRAFELQPSILHAFRGRSLDRLRRAFFTSAAFLRNGRSITRDSLQFTGYPIWQSDSLSFVLVSKDRPWETPAADAVGEALQHQRLRFRDLAQMWRAEFPQSADAAEAVAVGFEMLGNPAALDTLRIARALAGSSTDRLRMAVNEVWLRVKFSLPSNVAGLRAARALADSILWTHRVGADEEAVASLASLTGRAELAATYGRMDNGDPNLPAISQAGPALLAFAALGGPADSLRDLARIVDVGVQSLPVSSRDGARRDWLTRAATLAFPDYQFTFMNGGETGLRLGNLISASQAADTTRVRKILADISVARRGLRAADLMPDGLLPEAAALSRMGDLRGAVARLDPTLATIRFTASEDLAFNSQAGSLVRAMVLRADLASRLGDRETARLWARAVVELWSGADRFLQPTVQRMQQLAR